LSSGSIVHFEVRFPAGGIKNIEIPDEHLYRCFRSVRRGLERGAALLKLIGTRYWHTAAFEAESSPGQRHLQDSDLYLHWAKDLFSRLSTRSPTLAHADFVTWPSDEEFFFEKLKIFLWANAALFSGTEVSVGLLTLTESGFWNSYHRRELLHTLRARWDDIPLDNRTDIEKRIVAGRSLTHEDDPNAARKRNTEATGSILGWLRKNGCTLSKVSEASLIAVRSQQPEWNPQWEATADHSFDARVGYVAVKADPAKIIDLPIPQIIRGAVEGSVRPIMEFTEHRPFSGLVRQRPQRALAALAYQARHGDFPREFWETALSDWPEKTPERLEWLFAARLARLPHEIMRHLSHGLASWLKGHLPRLAKDHPGKALAIWDQMLAGLVSCAGEALQSGIGDTFINRRPQQRSRRTYEHAINGPIGA
jgi:hypothetical protein